MKCFASMEEVARSRLQSNIESAVSRSMQNIVDTYGDRYDPSAHGRVILYELASSDEDAYRLFGHSWANAPLEATAYCRATKTFSAVILLNNELAHVCIFPDMPWLSPVLRAHLMEHLCGEGPQ